MLENKVGMIFGVANKRSIAWACAQACIENGAKLAFTYQGERLKENVEKLTKDIPNTIIVPCDVQNQAEVDAAFEAVENEFGRLDFLIHSIAYAPREALEGEFLTTSARSFFDRARNQRIFADATFARRSSSDEKRRKHYHDELLRRGKSRAEL